jgi:uncharacterized repeat protein (TIGR01451 family)
MAGVLSGYDSDTYAVASMTNTGDKQSAGIQLKPTAKFTPVPLVAGHYYVFSIHFAEVHCRKDDTTKTAWRDAVETVTLFVNGGNAYSKTQTTCTDPASVKLPSKFGPVHVLQSYSSVVRASSGDSFTGFEVSNSTAEADGNDEAFNLPQLLDVTPQLYKSFNPSPTDSNGDTTVAPGQNATLTYTIQNTTDLQAKSGWSFTDNLPAGITVVSSSGVCNGLAITQTGTPATGVAIAVSGNLTAGQSSCAVTLTVSAPEGVYPNGPNNFSELNGLLPPNTATLSVADLVLNKIATVQDQAGHTIPALMEIGDKVVYTFEVVNSTAAPMADVNVEEVSFKLFLANGTTLAQDLGVGQLQPNIDCGGTGSSSFSLAAGATMTCTASYVVTQDVLNAVIAGGGQLVNQAKVTVSGSTTESPVSTASVLVSPPALTVTKATSTTELVVNDTVTFTFQVKNTGPLTLADVSIIDNASTGFTGSGTLSASPVCTQTTLAPGASTICTATYTVTADDVAAGFIVNTAQATANAWEYSAWPAGPTKELFNAPLSVMSNQVRLTSRAETTAVPALDAHSLATLMLLLGGTAAGALRWQGRRRG